MTRNTLVLVLFTAFALGLPLYGMQTNPHSGANLHECTGDCYRAWRAETGGVAVIARAQAQARSEASPVELGEQLYAGCIACHGAAGEGGIGPSLVGQSVAEVSSSLRQYRSGETRGTQSSLMWGQAAQLSDPDIDNLAAFIAEF